MNLVKFYWDKKKTVMSKLLLAKMTSCFRGSIR